MKRAAKNSIGNFDNRYGISALHSGGQTLFLEFPASIANAPLGSL